jgi:murein L,D-transpeptidase YcbB/YkuD
LVLLLLLTSALVSAAQDDAGWADGADLNPNARAAYPGPQVPLHALILRGRLSDLRWPDFSEHRADVEEFYSRIQYARAWLRNGRPTPQALQMIAILQEADSDGLRAEDYDSFRWLERLAYLQRPHFLSDEMRFDLALTVCAIRYVADVRMGTISPRDSGFALDEGPKKLDLAMFVQERLADGKDLRSELERIEPPFPGYHRLRNALPTYLRLAREDNGEPLPMPTDLGYPGHPYAGYVRLATLLRRLGDLPDSYSVAQAASQPYDPALVQAVRRFQNRHGLSPTGYLDAATIEQLNVPLRQRVEQIRLALERYRWMRYDSGQRRMVVNIPAFHLYAFEGNGELALAMKVDVGEDFDQTRTPLMEDSIEYLVFRPYWEVPRNILLTEIIPMITADPKTMLEYRLEVVSPAGEAVTRDKVSDEVLRELRAGRLRVRQRPGPYNAMGLVKFVFPNRYNVYLHDVPEREFRFVLGERIASHGCIHVEKPAELAAWMLRGKTDWSLRRVQQAMYDGQDSRRVNLSHPLPVRIVYATATAAEDGEVHFYSDIYGYDAELSQALAAGYSYQKSKVLPKM